MNYNKFSQNVKYVYIGLLEKEGLKLPNGTLATNADGTPVWAPCDSEGLSKFADHPESYALVYENDGVSIFKVKNGGEEG